jgi:N-acylneuraminate cytidylyltransferase
MNIAFIPARKGSKSIPLKNINPFCGQPLIYWTLLAAEKSNLIDQAILATDSDTIAQTAQGFNFQKLKIYRRDPENATDTASTEAVMLEYLNKTKSQYTEDDKFILLQATSPFTKAKDIDSAVKLLLNGFDSVLSVVPFRRFLWKETGTPINYDYKNRLRRQNVEPNYLENGALYINSVMGILSSKNRLKGKIGLYIMPEYTGVEIDEPSDWIIAENIFRTYCFPNQSAATKIKLVLSDVDGVLTDAGMYYSESGGELKKFNTHDGMGFELLRKAGIKTGIITSEKTQLVEQRAQKLKVDYLYQGKRDGGKLEAAIEICKIEKISLQEVAYIGDDLNCINLLKAVGLPGCPKNSVYAVKSIPCIQIMSTDGGKGAFREFAEHILVNLSN